MDIQKFTERAQGFLQAAQTIAIREFNQRLTPEHLLKALLDDEEGAAAGLIRAAGGDPQAAKQAVDAEVARLSKVQGAGAGQPQAATELVRVLDAAQQAAVKAGDDYVAQDRLLLALSASDTPAARALRGALSDRARHDRVHVVSALVSGDAPSTKGAAETLAKDGIEAEVIDLRTLRPIDYGTILKSLQKTNRMVTVEEGFPVGSIGNHLSAWAMENAFDWLDAPVINCTGKDVPMPYAANLEKFALVTAAEVVEAVRKVTYR